MGYGMTGSHTLLKPPPNSYQLSYTLYMYSIYAFSHTVYLQSLGYSATARFQNATATKQIKQERKKKKILYVPSKYELKYIYVSMIQDSQILFHLGQ